MSASTACTFSAVPVQYSVVGASQVKTQNAYKPDRLGHLVSAYIAASRFPAQ